MIAKDLEPVDFSREEMTRCYMERMGAWMQAPAETEGQRKGAYEDIEGGPWGVPYA